MIEALETVELAGGERVEAVVVRGPDLAWAERIEALLGHKAPFWRWQNSAVVRQELGLEARFYLLHRGGDPFANVLTVEVEGTGHLGHVFTRPQQRRRGAAHRLLAVQMKHFRRRGGRALFLHTGFDTPPFRLYERHGFGGVEPASGSMEYYAEPREAFEARWFAPGPVEIREVGWPDWPASAPALLAAGPAVRCPGLGLAGRCSTEGPFLRLVREESERRAAGEAARARVLVSVSSRAVVGVVFWQPHPLWAESCLVDLHCHEAFGQHAGDLLASLPRPATGRLVAHADVGSRWKESALAAGGWRRIAVLPRWAAYDAARTRWADVGVWERGRA